MLTLKMDGDSKVRVVEQPDPTPGPDQVLIRTVVSALCGSELHTYRGPGRPQGNSGHEAAGTIISAGSQVTSMDIGARVGISAVAGCGECAYCAEGRQTWCAHRRYCDSTHATLIVAPESACRLLPDDVPWEAGVLLAGDGLGVPYHTSTRLAAPSIRTVAIFGAGPIGLGNTLMQTFLGREVIVVEPSTTRGELSRRLGATQVIDPRATDPVTRIRELTHGLGADACLEAAGRPDTLKQCFAAVRSGGTVAMNGEQPDVPLSPSDDFIRRDITAFGSWFYQEREYPRMIAAYRQGLAAEHLITHRYPLAEADSAFAEFAAGKTGKVLLTMPD